MANAGSTAARKRTAVLVVHGIGSQRALETVRGVVRGVWLDEDDPAKDQKRVWTHPEPSGVDIDLSVMTTSRITAAAADRNIDFHELYWAHLMSETRTTAVLLWLFELGRRGPRFKLGVNGLWWSVSIFLSLLILSVTLIAVQAITWLAGLHDQPQSLPVILILMLLIAALAFALTALRKKRIRLTLWSIGIAIALVGVTGVAILATNGLIHAFNVKQPMNAWLALGNTLLPVGVAALAVKLLMGRWGLAAFGVAYSMSIAFFCIYLGFVAVGWAPSVLKDAPAHDFFSSLRQALAAGRVPWSLASKWSAGAGWVMIAAYLVMNAAFLQPYLGDAARYFRNSPANVAVRRKIRREAVDMLDGLHQSGAYDRIIIVAHSLGSVIAYDMLRAYYGRIHNDLPDPDKFEPELSAVDQTKTPGALDEALRAKGRKIVAGMARALAKTLASPPPPTVGLAIGDAGKGPRAWLVSDFVTLGAALTHAYYLMCEGNTYDDLSSDFDRRVREREYLTCPPARPDDDGMLVFTHWQTKVRKFHHGGLFGLTRWTNLYFPFDQIFWGDAIGGPLAPIFGVNVLDVPVSTDPSGKAAFFTHTAYWDIKRDGGRKAPHIVALRKAVNLEDV